MRLNLAALPKSSMAHSKKSICPAGPGPNTSRIVTTEFELATPRLKPRAFKVASRSGAPSNNGMLAASSALSFRIRAAIAGSFQGGICICLNISREDWPRSFSISSASRRVSPNSSQIRGSVRVIQAALSANVPSKSNTTRSNARCATIPHFRMLKIYCSLPRKRMTAPASTLNPRRS